MKNYTYYIKYINENGDECYYNMREDRTHRKSWFKTYEKAHKRMTDEIDFLEFMDYEVVEYKLHERNGNVILMHKK